ncbi:MAG: hypothetical protein SGPRY_003012, partial [Prymnesium sp.]
MSESFLAAIADRSVASVLPPAESFNASRLRERVRTSKRQPCVMIAPPTLSPVFNLEHSIHRPSRLLRDDIELVFRPDLDDEYKRHECGACTGVEKPEFILQNILVVPTWQQAAMDLSEISDGVNTVRRQLLGRFDKWAQL